MTTANYKYSIKSASGYSSDQKGKITPERHGVVCASLDGLLADDADLLKASPDLLKALVDLLEDPLGDREPARAAIARAKGEA